MKAILEYPLKYSKQLLGDVEKWSNRVIEQLSNDPTIQKLYDPYVAVYIGSWEIKCPHCSKWTPLIGNWWLARISQKEGEERTFTRLAWMKPEFKDDKVLVEVIDLNKVLKSNKPKGVKVDSKRGLVTLPSGKVFEVPKSNINPRTEAAVCLYCNNTIRYIDPQTGKHYSDKSKLPLEIKNRLIWYVKHALRKYQEKELSLANPVLLVKIRRVGGDLQFEACTEEARSKLDIAKEEMEKLLQQKDPDIPTEPIAPYSSRYIFPILYGMTEWYKLFNPRQTLTLVMLVKLIRDAGRLVEQEKLKEGSSPEAAKEYAEAK